MRIRTTDLGVLAIIVFIQTLWLLVGRSKLRAESNVPLFYYVGMVGYVRSVGTFINPAAVYAAVLFAMMNRFEFMSTGYFKFFRFVETLCLCYFVWACFDYFVIL